MSLKIISIILMVVLRFQNLEEITCVERIAFIENEIVSNKSLCFDDFNQPDLYFPKKQVTIQLSNTLDSLTQIQNNNWFIDSKHIIYKVTYSSKPWSNPGLFYVTDMAQICTISNISVVLEKALIYIDSK
jgi:hypothetical protein